MILYVKLGGLPLIKEVLAFYETRNLLPRSQKPATYLYPEVDHCRLQPRSFISLRPISRNSGDKQPTDKESKRINVTSHNISVHSHIFASLCVTCFLLYSCVSLFVSKSLSFCSFSLLSVRSLCISLSFLLCIYFNLSFTLFLLLLLCFILPPFPRPLNFFPSFFLFFFYTVFYFHFCFTFGISFQLAFSLSFISAPVCSFPFVLF